MIGGPDDDALAPARRIRSRSARPGFRRTVLGWPEPVSRCLRVVCKERRSVYSLLFLFI